MIQLPPGLGVIYKHMKAGDWLALLMDATHIGEEDAAVYAVARRNTKEEALRRAIERYDQTPDEYKFHRESEVNDGSR